ncbi:hypothetical protein D3C85_1119620 [compost metagenome]
MVALGAIQLVAGGQQAGFDQGAERHLDLGLLGAGDDQVLRRGGDDGLDAFLGHLGVAFVAFDADEAAAQALGGGARGAGAEEGVQDDVADAAGRQDDPVQQGLGLLGRVGLVAVLVLQALIAGAQGQGPVRAHLGVFVEGLQRVVVEGVALLLARLGGPDQGLVRIGEARALEVRHRVGLAPDDVVQHPEAQVLHRRAQAEDVVIAADDPERALVLQHPAAFGQPGAGEGVIGGEAVELVPVVVDRIDLGVVRPQQVAAQLQVIGRVGEDHVHRLVRQALQHLDAVATQDDVGLQLGHGISGPGQMRGLW